MASCCLSLLPKTSVTKTRPWQQQKLKIPVQVGGKIRVLPQIKISNSLMERLVIYISEEFILKKII